MFLFVKIFVVSAIIAKISCSKNVCDKGCIADIMLNKINLSKTSEHNITFLSSMIKYDEWNQVINNETSEEDYPHYVVPEISSFERGARKRKDTKM